MMLYLRFHLFNRIGDFQFTVQPPGWIATNDRMLRRRVFFVACKQEDTQKKLREILMARYTVRHPNGPEINPESQVPSPQESQLMPDTRGTETKDNRLRKTCP
jgi:CTD kinase subunit beta